MITINSLKAIQLCTSTDNSREVLTTIYCHKENGGENWTMFATNSHIGLKYEGLRESDWESLHLAVLDEYGFKMPKEITEGFLRLDKKFRGRNPIFESVEDSREGFSYPNYQNVIPKDVYQGETAYISFDLLEKIKKIYKLIGFNSPAYVPDSYDGVKATVKRFGTSQIICTLIVMPLRNPEGGDE